MTTDPTERDPGWRTVWAAGLLVATGAGIATAHGLDQVAAAARVPTPIGWLYPLITDGLALVAYAATARLHAGGRRYAAGIVILAAGLSGLAQAVYLAGGLDHTTTAPVGLRFGVGAWPAIAAALTAHLLHLVATGASPAAAILQRSPGSEPRAPSTPPYTDAPHKAAATPAVQPRPTDPRATEPVQPAAAERVNTAPMGLNTGERSGASSSARDRARAAARSHHARHGALPTVTELTSLANVARGTAANALKDLRAERPGLHVVNADTEKRTDQ